MIFGAVISTIVAGSVIVRLSTSSREIPVEELENRKKCCLSYWYPKLKESGVKTPKTIIFQTSIDLVRVLDGHRPDGIDDFIQNIKNAAESQIGYPLFLRTGQGAGKHDWKDTCFVKNADDLLSHMGKLIEWSHLVHMMGLPHDVWAIREMLQPEIIFTAFMGKFPVSKERRYFIQDRKVIGHIPYWPEESIAEWAEPQDLDIFGVEGELPTPKKKDIPDNWRELLAAINEESGEEVGILTDLSYQAAQHFDDAWSIDWLWDIRGEWYCTDMALAKLSWGWDQVDHD